jgi:hypothetical protein
MDDRRMLLSIVYRLARSLLGLTAVLVRRDLSKDADTTREHRVAPPNLGVPNILREHGTQVTVRRER